MADAALAPMTIEDFFVWQRAQDELYELVDGYPVPRHRMMTGASVQHDLATVNVIISLGTQLRGKPCRPTTSDIAIRTNITMLRRPDVMVECAALVPDTYEAREPRLVVEVASPSTTAIDQTRKVEEYKRHPTLAYILLIETLKPQALLYTRGNDAWEIEAFEGLEAVIALPAIGASLALADIYEGLSFPGRRDLATEG
ncbi:Uma2 family endonuclease [Methylobacterium sp. J-090]|uniref:Uma2 family endonuclease n=1 Tax=Methylobacterium sp. J-090 TaxID=2836666 RepID=UPI001FBBDA3B|nr:Uma2 family endonuclease [Methylobacterium sp. J-090]MCJ2079686.1 Uma2 family endonuclease [Methylobacterium sp. J-090]